MKNKSYSMPINFRHTDQESGLRKLKENKKLDVTIGFYMHTHATNTQHIIFSQSTMTTAYHHTCIASSTPFNVSLVRFDYFLPCFLVIIDRDGMSVATVTATIILPTSDIFKLFVMIGTVLTISSIPNIASSPSLPNFLVQYTTEMGCQPLI